MSKLSELVEELQEELAETKNQLSSLEEEHEYLENSFEMYKEEMKKTMEYYKQNMYMEITELRRSLENLHKEIAPALRGKSYGGSSIEYNPSKAAKLDYKVQRVYDPHTNTYSERKIPMPWMEW